MNISKYRDFNLSFDVFREYIYRVSSNFISSTTNKLIVVITGVFMIQLIAPELGINDDIFVYSFETVDPISSVVALFSHNDFIHYLTNVIFLYIIGHAIENHMSDIKFYGLFIVGGGFENMLSKIFIIFFAPESISGVIGSSGSICILLGVSVLLYYNPQHWSKSSIFTFICQPIHILSNRYDTKYNYGAISYQLSIIIFSSVLMYAFTMFTIQADIFHATNGLFHFAHFLGVIVGVSYQSIIVIKNKL